MKCFRIDSQIPFFCGDTIDCLTLGHPDAARKSIENIEKDFIVVGTLAMMDKTFAVMECLIPDYLVGLKDIKRKLMIKKHSKHDKTVPLNAKARKMMKRRLKSEYEVYNYVRDRLNRQYEECLSLGRVSDKWEKH